jgi:hypothetical protein
MDYKIIPIENIEPNPWNPNILKGIDFQKLKEGLDRENGNKDQPILVRPKED